MNTCEEGASGAHTHRGVVLLDLKDCAPSALINITNFLCLVLPVCSTTYSVREFPFFHILLTTFANLMNGKWYLIIILTCIALILALRSGHLLTAHFVFLILKFLLHFHIEFSLVPKLVESGCLTTHGLKLPG